MLIWQAMMGCRTKTVGTLTDGETGENYPLSLRPDSSDLGTYSIVIKHPSGETESFRMKYKGGQPLDDCMKHFTDDYLGERFAGRFSFEVSPQVALHAMGTVKFA